MISCSDFVVATETFSLQYNLNAYNSAKYFLGLNYERFAKNETFAWSNLVMYMSLSIPFCHLTFASTAIYYSLNDFDGLMHAFIGISASGNVNISFHFNFKDTKFFFKFE